jgi:tetratricopeptide (TPR) repeat protein
MSLGKLLERVGEAPAGSAPATAVAAALLLLPLTALFACGGSPPRQPPLAPLPRAAYAHYLAGRAAVFDEDPAASIPHLRAALAAAPDEPQLAVTLITALRAAADLASAQAEARRALARWPRVPAVWRASGELLVAAHSFAEAAAAFRRAIALDPVDEAAYIGLLSALQAQGELPGSDVPTITAALFTAVRQLIAAVPTSTAGRYLLAQLLLLEPARPQQRESALVELRTVLRLSPGHLDARTLLSAELDRAGRLPEAVAEARSAFDRSGEEAAFAEPLLRLLCKSGDRTAALDLLGLYDDAERTVEELLAVARWSLEIDEPARAQRLVDRARVAADPEALAELTPLAIEVQLTRVTRSLLATSLRGVAFTRCGQAARSRDRWDRWDR